MKYLFFAIIALLTLQSCNDIVATNIEGETPVLILPQSEDTVSNNPVHFKWEAMDGATKYRLQIATPSFANISDYVLDSVITGTDFYLDLDTLQYELKLTAMNAGYESNTLGPIKFWVGSTSTTPGGTTSVSLLTPPDSCYKNNDFDGNFTWSGITGGTSYKFDLVRGSSFSGGTPVYSSTASLSFETTLPNAELPLIPGQYFWGVKAYVGSTEQLYVTRTFFIDTVIPNVALLDLPVSSGSATAGTVTFTWHFTQTNETYAAPVNSTIEVATDLNFTSSSIVQSYTGPVFTHDFTLTTTGTYYWRVRNTDDAGNESSISEVRQLIVN